MEALIIIFLAVALFVDCQVEKVTKSNERIACLAHHTPKECEP